MKIDINKIKINPKSLNKNFELCVYGTPDDEISEWILNNNFVTYNTGNYTNIKLPIDIKFNEILVKWK